MRYTIIILILVLSITACGTEEAETSNQVQTEEQTENQEQVLEELTYLQSICEFVHIHMLARASGIEMSLAFADTNHTNLIMQAGNAITELEAIEEYLMNLPMPEEFTEARTLQAATLRIKSYHYELIVEQREDEVDLDSLDAVEDEIFTAYATESFNIWEEYCQTLSPEIVNLDTRGCVFELFENPEDSNLLEQGFMLMRKDKNFSEASVIFSDLHERYKGTPMEACIITGIVDCIRLGDEDTHTELGGDERALDILDEFIMRGEYSPYISQLYRQWRVFRQENDYGVSNWATIPNKTYIEVLWAVIESTEQYISDNPDDNCARKELDLLLTIALVERFGSNCQYGNSILVEEYSLWSWGY